MRRICKNIKTILVIPTYLSESICYLVSFSINMGEGNIPIPASKLLNLNGSNNSHSSCWVIYGLINCTASKLSDSTSTYFQPLSRHSFKPLQMAISSESIIHVVVNQATIADGAAKKTNPSSRFYRPHPLNFLNSPPL